LIKICEALNINPAVLFKDEDTDKADIKKKIIALINRL